MNSRNSTLGVNDLDINTWLNTSNCFGIVPNQICFKNEYPVIAIGGIVLLILLLR